MYLLRVTHIQHMCIWQVTQTSRMDSVSKEEHICLYIYWQLILSKSKGEHCIYWRVTQTSHKYACRVTQIQHIFIRVYCKLLIPHSGELHRYHIHRYHIHRYHMLARYTDTTYWRVTKIPNTGELYRYQILANYRNTTYWRVTQTPHTGEIQRYHMLASYTDTTYWRVTKIPDTGKIHRYHIRAN